MRGKRKPHGERTADDYRDAAVDALSAAKVLAGEGGAGGRDFLERVARSDELAEHDGGACGRCCNLILGAEVARELIEAGEYEEVVSKWAAETQRRWQASKFFKLWQEETEAGRDPRKAFEDRGGSRDRQPPSCLPACLPAEFITTLLDAAEVRIERIVSHGHASPEGVWYDQDRHEWVVVLKGAARLRFEDDVLEMQPGNFVNIPAHP